MLPEIPAPHKSKLTPRRPRQQVTSDDSRDGIGTTTTCDSSVKAASIDMMSPLLVDKTDSSINNLVDLTSTTFKEDKAVQTRGNVNNCLPEERRKKIEKQLHAVQKRVPGAKKMMDVVNLLPPRVRLIILSLWLLWKVILAIMFLHFLLFTTSRLAESTSQDVTSTAQSRFTREIDNNKEDSPIASQSPRILYVVTTLAEFNNGLRQTVKGQDRLGEVLIPILVDSVESMVHPPYSFHVDVYIIAAFDLKPEREEYIRQRLPDGVGLEVWDDACRKFLFDPFNMAAAYNHSHISFCHASYDPCILSTLCRLLQTFFPLLF